MDDSAITCDEIIEETVPTNLNGKKRACEMQNFYISSVFHLLLITAEIFIAVSSYCYLIKHWAKQNHLLPFHFAYN